jgi:hypothetical protein
MAFGHSALINYYESKTRFYNAYTVSETVVLKISRREYAKVVHTHAKKSFNEKTAFLKTIPDFNGATIPRSKLTTICLNLFTIHKNKSHILFREGDQAKNIFFIKSGEIKITRKVGLPHQDTPSENCQQIFEDPVRKRKFFMEKQHTIGIVSKGHILGLEEAIIG